jgi:dipeptidase E
MKLFLTSSIGGSYTDDRRRIPCALNNANHFLDNLKQYWKSNSSCLIITSDPDGIEMNDSFKVIFSEAFKLSNLSFEKLDVCDRRNEGKLSEFLYYYLQVGMFRPKTSFSIKFI